MNKTLVRGIAYFVALGSVIACSAASEQGAVDHGPGAPSCCGAAGGAAAAGGGTASGGSAPASGGALAMGGAASGGTDSSSGASGGTDSSSGASGDTGGDAALYTQTGSDPSWQEILANGAIPIGENSTAGVLGSTIDVNNARVEVGPNATRPVEQAIRIHTLGNSVIPRRDFDKWTRWYQEDENTQVFRLFEGEHNVRNSRPDAARIEAFSDVSWGRGDFHEWVGTYTIVKPHGCAIFQAKNNVNDWGVMLNLSDEGNITLNHRRHQDDVIIARNMTGKSFHIRVRDNGHDYEVYLNGEFVGSGHYDRPEGTTAFRWGMYDGTMRHDAMIFVTGATVDP